ncbi:MAG: N-acetylmuramoyl-L-alanine amidase [Oscillospiraceae bacterium]|nr:N-acetylmuramoyl-L-alanine amidase [Oscillospiraceae bacterium]
MTRYTRRRRSVLPKLILTVLVIAALAAFLLLFSKHEGETQSDGSDGRSELLAQQEGQEEEDTGIVVVIDPGHGGVDVGALSASEDVMEKDINLAVALYVQQLLQEDGLGESGEELTVVMTREDDSYLTLAERVELAESVQANLFVSIHANALENSTTWTGIYTYYHPDKPEDAALAQTVQQAVIAATGAVDQGANGGDYYVIRETSMPAILIETGFLSSPAELALLVDSDYQQKIAQGIADGILTYLSSLE